MELHDVCKLFPEMSQEELGGLTRDIATNGLIVPVWTYQGKIIDGRSRQKVCRGLNVELRTQEFRGDEDEVVPFVVALNLRRRHLNESQRAMVGEKLKPLYEEAARKRQANSTGGSKPQLVANLPQAEKGKSREKAAATVKVSPRLIDVAGKVRHDGIPELAEAVERGEVKVSAAATVATLSPEEEVELISKGPDAVREKAREIRESKPTTPDVVDDFARKITAMLDRLQLDLLIARLIEFRDHMP